MFNQPTQHVLIVALVVCLVYGSSEFPEYTKFPPTPLVCITNGCIIGKNREGLEGNQYEAYFGIPYAKPPLGKLRFRVSFWWKRATNNNWLPFICRILFRWNRGLDITMLLTSAVNACRKTVHTRYRRWKEVRIVCIWICTDRRFVFVFGMIPCGVQGFTCVLKEKWSNSFKSSVKLAAVQRRLKHEWKLIE